MFAVKNELFPSNDSGQILSFDLLPMATPDRLAEVLRGKAFDDVNAWCGRQIFTHPFCVSICSVSDNGLLIFADILDICLAVPLKLPKSGAYSRDCCKQHPCMYFALLHDLHAQSPRKPRPSPREHMSLIPAQLFSPHIHPLCRMRLHRFREGHVNVSLLTRISLQPTGSSTLSLTWTREILTAACSELRR